jgi:hypothetical protein
VYAPFTLQKAPPEIISRHRHLSRRWLLGALTGLPLSTLAARHTRRALICYPRHLPPADAPFYHSVVASLNEFLHSTTQSIAAPLTLLETPERLRELVQSSAATVVIALGTQTIELLKSANLGIPLLAGAAPLASDSAGLSGLSTVVDPASQLHTLTRFAPHTRRVLVVHHPRDAWLIGVARRAAAVRGLELAALAATSASDAAVVYLTTLRNMARGRDALWLMQEPEFLTTDLMQSIVEQAWNSSALVYSSVLEHVAQGVLFGTYPDPRRIAQRLARMAIVGATGVSLDGEPNTAVNVRTATHLVSELDMSQLASFTIRFGER